MLCVRHGPVPWYGNRELLIDEVRGVEIDYVYSSNEKPQYSVSVHVIAADLQDANQDREEKSFYLVSSQVDEGRQIVLLSGVKYPEAKHRLASCEVSLGPAFGLQLHDSIVAAHHRFLAGIRRFPRLNMFDERGCPMLAKLCSTGWTVFGGTRDRCPDGFRAWRYSGSLIGRLP